MKKHFSSLFSLPEGLLARTRQWPARSRIATGAALLAAVTAGATGIACLTGDDAPPTARSASPASPARASADGAKGAVPSPPRTRDPVVFAKAAAEALWAYDTRTLTQARHVKGLQAAMTSEKKYADFDSVEALVPDPTLWSRMHDNGQHADAKAVEAHMPQAFKAALADDPGAITAAYVYAVTVSGKQSIAWDGGGAGAEARAITLAVQCRPDAYCALSGVAPRVAP